MRCGRFPQLENVLKETLRLHPPLIILMRVAQDVNLEVAGHPIHWANSWPPHRRSPTATLRISLIPTFADPSRHAAKAPRGDHAVHR